MVGYFQRRELIYEKYLALDRHRRGCFFVLEKQPSKIAIGGGSGCIAAPDSGHAACPL